MSDIKEKYDYIIAGGGAAGLSLLYYISLQKNLENKKILVIDKEDKNSNDRTWCFWQTAESPYEEIIFNKWDKLNFHTQNFSKTLDIAPYSYKMLRSKDFYSFIKNKTSTNKNITFIKENIIEISDEGMVKCSNKIFAADFVFSSIVQKAPQQKNKHYLLQHFKGWFVKTEQDFFNPEKATLMDFRIDQKNDCRFVYVLPINKNEALVEYTIFSPEVLSQKAYDDALKSYFNEFLQLENYSIAEKEFGVIPMTNAAFPKQQSEKVFHVGTAGGNTKASTGYTFEFIQRACQQIADNLNNHKTPLSENHFSDKKFELYDATFLRVLSENKIPSYTVFEDMFKKLPDALPLKFLDEKTNLAEDLKVMYSVNTQVFLKAFLKELLG